MQIFCAVSNGFPSDGRAYDQCLDPLYMQSNDMVYLCSLELQQRQTIYSNLQQIKKAINDYQNSDCTFAIL